MNIRCLLPIACSVGVLLGCSTPDPAFTEPKARSYPSVLSVPLVHLAPSGSRLLPAQPCLVGTKKCADLDSQPFAPCLLTEKDCPREGEFIALETDGTARGVVLELRVIEPR